MKYVFLIIYLLSSSFSFSQTEIFGTYSEVHGNKKVILREDFTFIYEGNFSCVFPSFENVGEWNIKGDTVELKRINTEMSFVESDLLVSDSLYFQFKVNHHVYLKNYVINIIYKDSSFKYYSIDSSSVVIEDHNKISRFNILDRRLQDVYKCEDLTDKNSFVLTVEKIGLSELKAKKYLINRSKTRLRQLGSRTLFNKN